MAVQDQTNRLWEKFKDDGDVLARDQLIRANLHLVKYVIGRILSRYQIDHDAISVDDLHSSGVLGLMEAVDGFDPGREVKFVTYAIPRIRGAIIDELRAMDWVPRSLRYRVNQMQAVFAELEQELGRPATDTELSARLNLTERQLHKLLDQASRLSVLSLDEQVKVSEETTTSRASMVKADGDDIRQQIQREDVVRLLEEAIEELPEKERLVLILYYVEELTLKEIGKVLDVTESRICQLHSRGVMRLRGRLRSFQHDLAIE